MAATPMGNVGWSHWIRLFDADGSRRLLSAIPKTAGVYRIRVIDIGGQPIAIRRLRYDDPQGVLDIGESGAVASGGLNCRIETFQKAVLWGDKFSHAAGIKFHDYDYKSMFALETVCVDWISKSSKAQAKAFEKALLHAHRRRTLDHPPLNAAA